MKTFVKREMVAHIITLCPQNNLALLAAAQRQRSCLIIWTSVSR